MSDILTLDLKITARFDAEKQEILREQQFLEQLQLPDEDLMEKLNEEKAKLRRILEDSKELYHAETGLILLEYTEKLTKPISLTDCEALEEEKREITKEYVKSVSSLIRRKGWSDIELPMMERVVEICSQCGNSDKNKFKERRIFLECSSHQDYIETGLTHKDYDRVNIVGKFVYNRVQHFQDCIKQYQGKQNCTIPDKLYEKLDQKFQAYNLLNDSSNKNIRYARICKKHIAIFLKELKFSKYYEDINLIYFVLTNKRNDDIDYLEEVLINDFKLLVNLYDETYGKDKDQDLKRKNFINAQYLLFQLLRKHGHPCKAENFSMLKTTERKKFHDSICGYIFERLNWNFLPLF